MPTEVLVALIALGGALVGAILTLFTSIGAGITRSVREANERYRTARKLHEKYSDPLASAAIDLMYRFGELLDGRDYYLQTRQRRTTFESYKATSTLYRLAALIAWVRAFRREVFFLRADRWQPRKHQRALDDALACLSTALADGQHMESLRVESVVASLGLVLKDTTPTHVGKTVDFELDRFLHARGVSRLADLRKRERREAVRLAVSTIASSCAPIEGGVAGRFDWREVSVLLDAREAWIYRDWQSAIGDLLISPAPDGARAYDVIGYRQFERMCVAGDAEQRRWIARISALLDDLEMSADASIDARVDVVRAVYRACGQIIVAVHNLQGRKSPIGPKQLAEAEKAAGYPAPVGQSRFPGP